MRVICASIRRRVQRYTTNMQKRKKKTLFPINNTQPSPIVSVKLKVFIVRRAIEIHCIMREANKFWLLSNDVFLFAACCGALMTKTDEHSVSWGRLITRDDDFFAYSSGNRVRSCE